MSFNKNIIDFSSTIYFNKILYIIHCTVKILLRVATKNGYENILDCHIGYIKSAEGLIFC